MPEETFVSPLTATDTEPTDPAEVWAPFAYFEADWKADVKVTTAYRTELARSLHYNEQAHGRLLRPSRQIEYSIGAERGFNAFESMVFLGRAGTSRHLTPLLSDATLVNGVTGNSALCDTRWRRFFVGCRALFLKPGVQGKIATFYYDTITEILDDRLTFASPPTTASGWIVAPVIETEPLTDPSLRAETSDVSYINLVAKEADDKSALPPSDYAAWLAAVPKLLHHETNAEYPFFWPAWEWREGAEWSHDAWAKSYSSGNAEIYYRDPITRGPRWRGSQEVQADTRQKFWTVLNFFDYCRGKAKRFVNAIPLALPKPLSDVTSTITLPSLPALTDWRRLVWHLAVSHTGGIDVFDVVSAVRGGTPGTDVLTLHPAPASTILASNVNELRALQICRLASDSLVEKWSNNQHCEIKLSWEQSDDNPAYEELADDLIIHTAPILTIPNILACAAPGFPPPGGGDCCTHLGCQFDPLGYLAYTFERNITEGVTSCPNPYFIAGNALFVSCGVYEDSYYRFEWNGTEWDITYIGEGTDPRDTPAIGGGIKCLRCDFTSPSPADFVIETNDCDSRFFHERDYCADQINYIEKIENIQVFNDCE